MGAVEERLLTHGTPKLEVAEGAAKAGLESVDLGGRNALNDSPDAFGGDGVGVVFALHKKEAAVATVLAVQGEHGLRRGAGTGKGVEHDGVFVGCEGKQITDERRWLGVLEDAMVLREDLPNLVGPAARVDPLDDATQLRLVVVDVGLEFDNLRVVLAE